MYNCKIKYRLSHDGVITENVYFGETSKVGNLYRLVFFIENEGKVSKHVYVITGENSFNISVEGDTSYSVKVKQGESCNSTLIAGEVKMPFTATTEKVFITATTESVSINATYILETFGQKIKNVLKLKTYKVQNDN